MQRGLSRGWRQQHSFLVRALYYVFVGWWLSGLWLLTAWSLLAMTMGLALPLSFWMFNRAPAVTTLTRLCRYPLRAVWLTASHDPARGLDARLLHATQAL